MKKIVRSPGSATIVNAIATGSGSAFGINLDIVAEVRSTSSGIKCSPDLDIDTSLMELCAKNVFNHYQINFEDNKEDLRSVEDVIGIEISTKSDLPPASGLSSSSALSNAVTLAISELIVDEFDKKPMNDLEIVNLAIDSSLEAGVTITGAFDDATASYFGGVTVTDNINREIIIKEKMDNHKLLIYMPNIDSMTANSDVKRMKLLAPLVEMAFEKASQKEYYTALNLNGILYSNALDFDTKIAIDALSAGAIASGLSGTGSAYVAIIDNESKDNIKDIWNSYTDSGRIIETEVDNLGTSIIE
ncbi:shikimate kinase [Methanobrevibacter arboriphilus]|jgi:shikimate kinase|uniref:Shikimate kinase n=1 Tax=Methanobrevibacter arboriphilus TaxID=39441 RepID=A0ACA8R5M4_METAZ|nr:shikimate kinase [Methanobrevibacter arboriphilus]BBL62869.1 shikimate kinase [Methanobrevibacter arboriphilus]GLI12544.1 shikimate kinase [Methanobrevibacter arboriphilus]